MKQHLAGIKGQITACDAPLDVIGHIREEMLKVFEQYEEDKIRQKEIEDEIGRRRTIAQMRALHLFLLPVLETPSIMSLLSVKVKTLCLGLKVKRRKPSKAISHLPPLLALTMPMLLKFNRLKFSSP